MALRKKPHLNGEFYHVYNRGVDKRKIFSDKKDFERFLQSIEEFNAKDPIGSIYEHAFDKKKGRSRNEKALVSIAAYCLNPNHFHLLLRQTADEGIPKFMHRLATGYTKYFNEKYERSGALFQGPFKSIHVGTDSYLRHVSAYVNLNYRVHRLGSEASKSSWEQYAKGEKGVASTNFVLSLFKNRKEYTAFAEDTVRDIVARRHELPEELLFGKEEIEGN